MKPKDLVVDAYATCGQTAIARSIWIKYKYVDGVKTAEQEGYSIECVLPERHYNDITVSVRQVPDTLLQRTDDPVIAFDNLQLTIYGRLDDLRIVAKASAAREVDSKHKA